MDYLRKNAESEYDNDRAKIDELLGKENGTSERSGITDHNSQSEESENSDKDEMFAHFCMVMMTNNRQKSLEIFYNLSLDETVKLSDSIFLYTTRKMTSHGNVFEGEIRSGVYGVRPCAIKFCRKSEHNVREAKILTKLSSHTHVVSIIQSGIHKDLFEEHVYIALDKCHKQNLRQYFEFRKELGFVYDVNVGLEYSKQIIAGMTYVHENLIFHKDLKPSNILLSNDQSTIKLADFGMSQELKSNSSKVFCKHQFGTNGFRPPESFGNSWASLKSDIFSLGVVFYFILSNGNSPFGDDFHLWAYNTKKRVFNLSNLLVPNRKSCQHLIKLMLNQERCRRPTIWQVAEHPCWTGNEKELEFDYGCVEETDDSDVHIAVPTNKESIDLETDFKKTLEFLRALEKLGYGRSAIPKSSIVIFDGKSKHLQRFNPRNKTVTQMQEFNNEMKKKPFTSVCLGNYIYVLLDRSMYRLKHRCHEALWEQMADLIDHHGFHPPAVASSGSIILAGGAYGTFTKSVTKYDPSLNQWEKLKHKQLATDGSAIVSSQGYVYCVGGEIGGWIGVFASTNTVERLNVTSNSWDEVEAMREARWRASAVACGGNLIVVGGLNQQRQLLNTVEKYDPDANQWTTTKPMMAKRSGPWLVCHQISGNIYAVGPFSQGIEKFDSEKDEWNIVALPEAPTLDVQESVMVT